MENHSNSTWQKRTRLFISKKANTKVELKMKKLLEEVDKSLSKEKSAQNIEHFINKFNFIGIIFDVFIVPN